MLLVWLFGGRLKRFDSITLRVGPDEVRGFWGRSVPEPWFVRDSQVSTASMTRLVKSGASASGSARHARYVQTRGTIDSGPDAKPVGRQSEHGQKVLWPRSPRS